MYPLRSTMFRIYKNKSVDDFIRSHVNRIANSEELFDEFKNNSDLQKIFMNDILYGGKTIMESWICLAYDECEKLYVESVNKERELRKKCGINLPEDDEPINLNYVTYR